MATKLYLENSISDYGSGNNDAKLSGTASAWFTQALTTTAPTGGAGGGTGTATVAGPTSGIEYTETQPIAWYSTPLDADITISGSITWNIWAAESAMAANVAINGQIEVVDGATGAVTLIDKTARTTEAALTTRAVANFSETPGAGVACKRGDRLRVRIFGDDSVDGNMAAASTFNISYSGGTPGADGDTWVQLTENLTFVSEPAGSQVFLTDTASTVSVTQSVAGLLSAFAGANEDPLSEGGNWAQLSTSVSAPWKIVSNQIVSSGGATAWAYWTPADFGPEVEAYATIATVPAAGHTMRILARVQDAGGVATFDGYSVMYATTGTAITINRVLNSTPTTLATATITALTNGAKLGIACHGSVITAWVQPSGGAWQAVALAVDTTYPSAGKIALHAGAASGSVTAIDDVYAGTNVYDTFTGGSAGAAITEREAWTSRGGGVQTDVTNTVAGWTAPIQVTDTAGGTVVDWFTKPLVATTLGGAVRCNIRALESNAAANAAVQLEIARVEGDGTSPTVWAAGVYPFEIATTESARSFLIAGDDLAITDGQRLRIRVAIDDGGTISAAMGASQTVTLYYAGTSGGASGDTYVTFTQTLTEYSAVAANPPYRSPYPPILAQ